MNHAAKESLALLATGDAGWWDRLVLNWHVRSCQRCRAELEAFREGIQELATSEAELPPGVDWPSLEQEMTANIRLGLEAGACVTGSDVDAAPLPPVESPVRWRPAVALAGVALLAVGGWWLQTIDSTDGLKSSQTTAAQRSSERRAPDADEIVLRATMGGIGVERDGRTMALTYDGGEALSVSVGAQGTLKARYLDEDSGQVTIHHVYVE